MIYSHLTFILHTTWTTPKPLLSTTASGNTVSPPPRKLMRMHYRRTIAVLWSRMQHRGTYLSITHVHSHLEKETPRDHPLYRPRWQLAAADTAADAYHSQDYQTVPSTGTERFPIYH